MCKKAKWLYVKCSYIDPNDQLDMSVSTEKKQKHIFFHNLKFYKSIPLVLSNWNRIWWIKNPLKPIYGWVLTDLFTAFIEIFQSTLLSCNWSNLLVFIVWQFPIRIFPTKNLACVILDEDQLVNFIISQSVTKLGMYKCHRWEFSFGWCTWSHHAENLDGLLA